MRPKIDSDIHYETSYNYTVTTFISIFIAQGGQQIVESGVISLHAYLIFSNAQVLIISDYHIANENNLYILCWITKRIIVSERR